MLHLEKPTTKSPHIAVKPENSHKKKKKEKKIKIFSLLWSGPSLQFAGASATRKHGPVQQEKHSNFEMIVQI